MRFPSRIDDGLMRKDGIGAHASGPHQGNCEEANAEHAKMDEHSFNNFGPASKISFQIQFQEKTNRPSSLEERLGVTNRNAEIGAAETSHNGKCYPDDFPIAIDQGPAGPAGSGLRIV